MRNRRLVAVSVTLLVLALIGGVVASSIVEIGGQGTHMMPDGSTMREERMP